MYRNYISSAKQCRMRQFDGSEGCLKSTQRGSALVIAVFIIIVISLLGAALVKILDSSQENVAFEVIGTRAYTAAQIGVQWQLAQIFPLAVAGNDAEVRTCNDIVLPPPTISGTKGLHSCDIVLDAITHCEEFLNQDVRYFRVTSTGQCNIDGEIVSRTVQVEARSL